jgi:2-keto-4-pentenoate hydratase/2-oxohepta-3-ene-1,7-dioic acid hydratase in catechol pathway
MRLLQYLDDEIHVGVYDQESNMVVDAKEFVKDKQYSSMNMFVANNLQDYVAREVGNGSKFRGMGKPISKLKILPPVYPQKIFCIAMNYKSHIEEVRSKMPGFPTPSRPIFFTKLPNALIGHQEAILVPKISSKVDYEIELAVIIGRKGKYIRASEALDYVAGYSVCNDVSFRDWQFPPQEMRSVFGQDWIRGKGLDSSLPLGPFLTTKDEVSDPQNLRISLYLNDELRQDGSTSDMLFDVSKQIEWLSDGITLEPGDVICTGSCTHLPGDKFLKRGDIVKANIEKVGQLENHVVQEAP